MILTFFQYLFRDLRRQPVRTLLTLSGVMWGTFAVVLLLAFGASIQGQNMKAFQGVGDGFISVTPQKTTKSWQGFLKGREVKITVDDVTWLRERVPGIRRISPEFRMLRRIGYGRRQFNNMVRGTNVEYGAIRNVIPGVGRYINEIDVEKRRRVCLLGDRLARNLFGAESPLGRFVVIEGMPFQVVGVMQAKIQNMDFGQKDEECAFVPWSTFVSLYGRKHVDAFLVQMKDPLGAEVLIGRIRRSLSPRIGFAPDDEDALWVWNLTEFQGSFRMFFVAFRVFLALIGLFTLLVGGVGVASIMLVVVEERTREIGIKIAVGARRRTILWLFFLEALLIVCTGGAMGFLLAALVIRVLPRQLLEQYIGVPAIDPAVALSTMGILMIVAVISGTMPARKAASTDPIQALRK